MVSVLSREKRCIERIAKRQEIYYLALGNKEEGQWSKDRYAPSDITSWDVNGRQEHPIASTDLWGPRTRRITKNYS